MAKSVLPQKDLMLLAAVAVIIIGGFLFFTNLQPATPSSIQPTIEDAEDLDETSKDLDEEDVNAIDIEMNYLNTDATGI